MRVGGQRHAMAILPLGKFRDPLYRRLDGPQGQSGRVQKILPAPGFDPRTVQPSKSLYRLSYPGQQNMLLQNHYINTVTHMMCLTTGQY